MNYIYHPKEQERVAEARESFSGRLLSNAQFDEAMAITGIVEREIQKSGAFKDKLGDYAYAFARSERFDAVKAETVIRDLFKARTGQTMNEMREGLVERESKLTDDQVRSAYDYAAGVGEMIEKGDKVSFYRAYTHQAQALATELGITESGAMRLMKEEFSAGAGKDLYEWGKAVEDEFYRPQIEAERQKSEARAQERGQDRGADRSRGERDDGRRSDFRRAHDSGESRGQRNGGDHSGSRNRTRSRVGPRP